MAALKEERDVEDYKRKGRRSSQVRGLLFLLKKSSFKGKRLKKPNLTISI